MKVSAVAILLLILAAPGRARAEPKGDCGSLVMQSVSSPVDVAIPEKGEKYRRPPMVSYRVRDDGSVVNVRVVRRSGVKQLDRKLFLAASQWRYQTRAGCPVAKVRLAAGPVANEATAVKIAEPEMIRTYGARVIASERPITATLLGDVWVVAGTLSCSDGKGGITTICVGGVATAHLSKSDGRVLNIFHTM